MIANIVVGAVVLVCAALAVRGAVKRRKNGGCGCGCGSADCPHCKKN